MTITLHYLPDSRCRRAVWCLEELGIPYDVIVYHKDMKTFNAADELKGVNPNGTAPVLTDGDKTLIESGLILEYLVEKYGQDSELKPRSHDEELEIRMNNYASESNIMIFTISMAVHRGVVAHSPMGLKWLMGGLFRTIDGIALRPHLDREIKRIEALINANGGYVIGGHLTAADIMLEASTRFTKYLAIPDNYDKNYPVIASWWARLSERPAHKRAVEIIAKLDALNDEAKDKPIKLSADFARL